MTGLCNRRLVMWQRLIMSQLQPCFGPNPSRLALTLSHATLSPARLPSAVVVPSWLATSELATYGRTLVPKSTLNHSTSLRFPTRPCTRSLHAQRGSSCAASVSTTSGANHIDDISNAEWSEVEARLGEMAASKNRPSVSGVRRNDFELMPIFMQRAGLTRHRLAALNFIHVAGTKGKGSTCAMVESILRTCGYRTALYTSPHLVDVRERIRVDGQMLPRAEFAAAFHRVYGALKSAADLDEEGGPGMPSFFYFITIMAMDALLARPLHLLPHAVVLEVGIGGRLDATNAMVGRGGDATRGSPSSLVAAAITSLGYDHMELLGDTLPKIAREKAGVMKAGRPVLVAPQEHEAMEALREVASRVGAQLLQPPPLESYSIAGTGSSGSNAPLSSPPPSSPPPLSQSTPAVPRRTGIEPHERPYEHQGKDMRERVVLGLGGEHMRMNASLAVALAAEWEVQYGAAAAAAAAGEEVHAVTATARAAAAGRPVALAPGGPNAAAAAARAAAVHSLTLPYEYATGLSNVRWPGRSQVVEEEVAASRGGRLTLYLDGAHTPESMAVCATWFAAELLAEGVNRRGARPYVTRHVAVLLFNCMRERDPAVLLPALAAALADVPEVVRGFDAAIFTPMLSGGGVLLPANNTGSNIQSQSLSPPPSVQSYASAAATGPTASSATAIVSDLTLQTRMRDVWESIDSAVRQVPPPAAAAVEPGMQQGTGAAGLHSRGSGSCLYGLPYASVAESLPAALEALRDAAVSDPRVHVHVLVTGSLYLVGDVLRLLNKPPS